jgi:hypothetical protein
MFQIEKDVPIPNSYKGRRSKKREAMIETMKNMRPGESFRVEYKLTSMRNFLRVCEVSGVFRAARDAENFVRVWRIS